MLIAQAGKRQHITLKVPNTHIVWKSFTCAQTHTMGTLRKYLFRCIYNNTAPV